MSELANIKPVAFYRADWKGDMMFRKDNTVVIRKNEGDFTTGWIKPLYDELPEPQPQLIILKNIADELDKRWETQNKYLQRKIAVPRDALYNAVNPYDNQLAATKIGKWIDENQNICFAYLAGKALGVDLVKVVEG
ncbi:hypothetical protein LL14B4_04720 [Lactococcus lactis subsp. lactis]|uniref:Phage protein n=1 Tax=Lactococcus lactis subsp. lactis TaxID=1360 RepID=A0A2Z3KMB4_LACLL|nr:MULTISPECIES: hypothetical protein [Lactococcus]AWN65513.1 hypothetical protein LL14B4_04720 [Lactococcus lactis subsp. lactis]MBK0029236.1 hypothetical protein [Lactococcus sp. S47]